MFGVCSLAQNTGHRKWYKMCKTSCLPPRIPRRKWNLTRSCSVQGSWKCTAVNQHPASTPDVQDAARHCTHLTASVHSSAVDGVWCWILLFSIHFCFLCLCLASLLCIRNVQYGRVFAHSDFQNTSNGNRWMTVLHWIIVVYNLVALKKFLFTSLICTFPTWKFQLNLHLIFNRTT